MLKRCEMKVLWIAALLLAPMPAAFAEDLRLVMPFSPGERLDPAFEYAGWYMRQAGVYETLFSYDTEMNLVPELAEGYELASETEWIVHLPRRGSLPRRHPIKRRCCDLLHRPG
jgi:ABC-type transport system substrate-binding protein